MKSYLLIFVLAPFFCFAQQNRSQTTENKSSGTDCPTWKKKDVKANKADYFQYLKTSKSQKSLPVSTVSKEKVVSPRQTTKNEELDVLEKSTVLKTDEGPTEKKVPQKKKKTVVSQRENRVQVVDNKENTANMEIASPVMPQAKSEDGKKIAKTTKAGEQNSNSEKAAEPDSDKNEKLEEEKTKAKQKLTRLTRKTTKVRKHSNSKCPSF